MTFRWAEKVAAVTAPSSAREPPTRGEAGSLTSRPRIGTGRSTLGHTETADVDEAIGCAVRRGAERIVLFGWAMGAAIALQLAARPRHDGVITALVLDWTETIKANCARSGYRPQRGSSPFLGSPSARSRAWSGCPRRFRSGSSTGSPELLSSPRPH